MLTKSWAMSFSKIQLFRDHFPIIFSALLFSQSSTKLICLHEYKNFVHACRSMDHSPRALCKHCCYDNHWVVGRKTLRWESISSRVEVKRGSDFLSGSIRFPTYMSLYGRGISLRRGYSQWNLIASRFTRTRCLPHQKTLTPQFYQHN